MAPETRRSQKVAATATAEERCGHRGYHDARSTPSRIINDQHDSYWIAEGGQAQKGQCAASSVYTLIIMHMALHQSRSFYLPLYPIAAEARDPLSPRRFIRPRLRTSSGSRPPFQHIS